MRTITLMAAVLVLAAACSGPPDAGDAAKNVQEIRNDVIDRLRSVAGVATASDERVVDAQGSTRLCGDNGNGVATLEYAASAILGPSDVSETSRIASFARALVDAGWRSTTPEGADDFAQLRREGVNLSIQPASRRDGSRVGDGSLSLSFTSRCVEVGPEQVQQDETVEKIDLR